MASYSHNKESSKRNCEDFSLLSQSCQVARSHKVSCRRWEELSDSEKGQPQITIMDIQAAPLLQQKKSPNFGGLGMKICGGACSPVMDFAPISGE